MAIQSANVLTSEPIARFDRDAFLVVKGMLEPGRYVPRPIPGEAFGERLTPPFGR